jgi:hypothetical protein
MMCLIFPFSVRMKWQCLLLVATAFAAHADSIFAPPPGSFNLKHSTGFFEVRAIANVQIERLQIGVAGNSFPISISYKPGPYAGFEPVTGNSPWIHVFRGYGSAVALNIPSYPIVLREPVRVPAGETVSFRVESSELFTFVNQAQPGVFAVNNDLILWGGNAMHGGSVIPNRRIWGIVEYSLYTPDPEPTPTPTPTPTPEPTPVLKPTLTVFGPNRIVTRRNAVALQGSAPHARYVTATYKVRRKSGKRRPVTVTSPVDAAGIFRIGVKPRGAATRVWLTAHGDEGTVSQSWSVRILPSAKAKKRR